MQNYDDRLELAPRDVVSHAIMAEAKKTGIWTSLISLTKTLEFVRNRFPMDKKRFEA